MRFESTDRAALQRAALGVIPCDFALHNIRFVNVFTGETYPAVVYVYDGFICHVDHFCAQPQPDRASRLIDGHEHYLIPGFIDAHVHIESSMCTPRNFARAVLPHGTTTVITDPHEIANVLGEDGVRYMLESSEDLPMRQLVDIPSCVPSVPGMENAGAAFDADTIHRLATLPRVAGLAEVMDFIGVATADDRMSSIVAAAEKHGLYLQGHLPASDPRLISAYLIGGPETCHETTRGEDALTKMRSGMFVDARQSSIAQDLPALVPAIQPLRYLDRMTICSDDKEADDILRVGHMDDALRKAVALGMDSVDAVRCATLNPAREAHLEHLGAIAPGYVADMLLVDNLIDFNVAAVYYGGKLVVEKGQLVADISAGTFAAEQQNTMQAPQLRLDDFILRAPEGSGDTVEINALAYPDSNGILTECAVEHVPVVDGNVDLSACDGLCHAIVINRYGLSNVAHGLVRNFGLQRGANGSTVSHDCHNLTIVYKDPSSGFAAYQALCASGGGMCCVEDGNVTLLPLPVAGLMSREPCEVVAAQIETLKAALRRVGMRQPNPMMRIPTLALPVIPRVRFSDMGLIDVMQKQFLPLFPTTY